MPVRLRLQRRGRKKYPTYRIVASEAKKPRDGRFIDMLGYYNPHTNPATIELDNEKALKWLQNGAQASPTVNRILSYKGVKYWKHLQRGVKMGVITQEQADDKYAKWLEEKAQEVEQKVQKLKEKADQQAKAQLEAEAEANKKKAEEIQAKKGEEAGEGAEEGQSAQAVEEEATAEPEQSETQQTQAESAEADNTAESGEEQTTKSSEEESASSDASSEEATENNT